MNAYTSTMKSKCCSAELITSLEIEYFKKPKEELLGRTNYFVCSKCMKPCKLNK